MGRAMLHIGFGKTGTTSIQRALGHLRAEDELGGVTYPALGGRNDHSFVSFVYKDFDRLERGLLSRVADDPERAARLRDVTRRELEAACAPAEALLLSSEYLEGMLPDEADHLVADLRRWDFDRIAVLAYVRDPAGLYLSRVQQAIKASSTFVPPWNFKFSFRKRLEIWDRDGVELHVRDFDPARLIGGDVVQDVFAQLEQWFGVPLSPPDVPRVNESLSAEGMILVQRYRRDIHPDAENRFRPDSDRLLRLIQATEAELDLPTTRPALAPWARRLVVERHLDQLGWLRDRFGIEFDTELVEAGDPPPRDAPLDLRELLAGWNEASLEALTSHTLHRLLTAAD